MEANQTNDKKTCKFDQTILLQKDVKRSPKQLLKPYYYTAYFLCPTCKRMFFSDKYKIINNNYSLFTEKDENIYDVQIWTDGASSNNGRENAKAAWAFVAGKYEEAGLVPGKQTNNRAEGYAIYHALKWAGKKGYKKIKLHTDSQISLFGVAKRHENVKENREIFALIAEEVENNHLKVTYEKVLGHAGDVNNERADRLAVALSLQ